MPKDTNKVKKEKKHFFKDFKAELKKVIWPSPKQLVNNTVAVITIVLITAIIVFALDLAFEKMNTYGVNKLKELVENSTQNTVEGTDDSNTEDATENTEDSTSENAVENSEENTTTEDTQSNDANEVAQ